MKTRILFLGLLVMCFAASAVFAADASLGTWKSNPNKSDFGLAPPTPKIMKVEAMGDNIHITINGQDDSGRPTHSEFLGKYDGKDYPVTGDAGLDSWSYKKIDDYTFEMVGKRGGKVTSTAQVVYSRDGKTRTAIQTSDVFGQKVTYKVIWDRQ